MRNTSLMGWQFEALGVILNPRRSVHRESWDLQVDIKKVAMEQPSGRHAEGSRKLTNKQQTTLN